MKVVVQYLLLVGIPLLCLLGVLWAGADLQAPQSVGGVWAVAIDPSTALGCAGMDTWEGDPQLVISQSGDQLTLLFNDTSRTRLDGKLNGLTITAEGKAAPDSQITLHFQALVDPESSPERMSAELSSTQCQAPIGLDGIRQLTPQTAREAH
jgi:hypothetical protein